MLLCGVVRFHVVNLKQNTQNSSLSNLRHLLTCHKRAFTSGCVFLFRRSFSSNFHPSPLSSSPRIQLCPSLPSVWLPLGLQRPFYGGSVGSTTKLQDTHTHTRSLDTRCIQLTRRAQSASKHAAESHRQTRSSADRSPTDLQPDRQSCNSQCV